MNVRSGTTARIAALHVYPIKSCRGLTLESVVITPTGFEGDRQWMVVNESGRFLTQRELPRLALVVPTREEHGLRLTAPGMPEFAVRRDRTEAAMRVTVWNDSLDADDAGKDAADWLSQFLGRAVRLVRFATRSQRPSAGEWTGDVLALNQFSDGFPILATSLASLGDLNKRLADPVPMSRFRPNVVLEGLQPYDEDRIHELVGDTLRLRLVKPCARCKITTTDQLSGEVMGDEPLKTLKAYRWSPQLRGILFGQNVIVIDGVGSTLSVGQSFKIVWK